MKLSDVCISRPVFTIVINLLLLIVGFVSYQKLEVRELPKMEQPTVTISTSFAGADAELIETEITSRIEETLSGLEGLDFMRSSTRSGNSRITVYFKSGYDVEAGMNDIRDKISRVQNKLPADADSPVLAKVDTGASPTMYIAFTDETRSRMALTNYIDLYIKPVLEQVEGVGSVDIYGAQYYSMRIWPDPAKMAARNVTVTDIKNVLINQNVNIPGGEIKSGTRNYTLIPQTKSQSLEDFNELIIRYDAVGGVVRFKDVADIEIGPLNDESFVRANTQSGVVVAVTPQSTANPVTVSKDVNLFLDELRPTLPTGMHVKVNYDKSVFIKASIDNVYKTLYEAVILVILVVFVFLGSFRAAMVPIVTIPLCLISIFGFLYLLNYSINNMTLLALVLAIGLVVDDAIVMLENIHRHIENGLSPLKAAFKGSREIGFAIIAMTITLAAVYAPIGFMTGLTGDVFKEFAFTLAGAVIISGFVALTLSPMMCSKLLTSHQGENAYTRWVEKTLSRLTSAYEQFLRRMLNYRGRVVIGSVLLALLGTYMLVQLKQELAPLEDSGTIFSFVIAPTGANLDYLDKQLKQLETIYTEIPEQNAFVAIGGRPIESRGLAFLTLDKWENRDRTQAEIIKSIFPKMSAIPGALVIPQSNPPLPSTGNSPIEFVIQTNGSYTELRDLTDQIQDEIAKNNPNLQGVQVDLRLNMPQYRVYINKPLAADLKVDVTEVNNILSILLAGATITEFEFGTESYDVKIQAPQHLRKNIEQINDYYVRSDTGAMIPLGSLVSIKETVGAEELSHFNRLRSATLTAELTNGYTQGEAVEYLQTLAQQLLPESAKHAWGGQTKDFLEASGAMVGTIILALIFIYLVLAAQFESFRDPLTIMLTVPFSIIGAVIVLHMVGGTNNLYTQIGFVTLIGLITKHGILITEFANQLQAQGKSIIESVVESACQRLRPILMTTGAMVLGAIPLALASGAGAYARSQLGWTIVGGMTFGTIFSLLVVPVAYTYLAKPRKAL